MDFPIKVPLTRPIKNGDEDIAVLWFDEPDLDATIAYAELEKNFPEEPGPVEAGIITRFWISHSAGVSSELAGKVKESDMAAVNEALDKVLGLPAGEGEGDTSGNETPAK